jgi:hypothetical protein
MRRVAGSTDVVANAAPAIDLTAVNGSLAEKIYCFAISRQQ